MRFGSVCSGIEAASVAWLSLGWHCEFVAEIERFPSSVLKHHYPNVPNYGDITKFKEWPDHAIDVLVGGTPCQSFSVAGLRAGIGDPRGNLALTFLAIAQRYKSRWILWENVPGVHSSWSDETIRAPTEEECDRIRKAGGNPDEYEYAEQTNDFDCFVSGLEQLGYGVATTILDAQYFNLAQRRERVFVVGCAGGKWQRAAAVLFDSTSLRGDSAPSREAGKRADPTLVSSVGQSGTPNDFHLAGGLAPTLPSRNSAGGGMGTDFDCDGGVIPTITPSTEVSQPAKGNSNHRDDAESYIAHSLRADGYASEDGTGRGTPLVPAVAWALQERDSKGSDSKGSDSSTKEGHLIPVENQVRSFRTSGNCGPFEQGDKSAALNTQTDPTQTILLNRTSVRRLTPRECERLQGFPDDYTKITEKTADGPRYKALGNSMATPVIFWIGQRIQMVDKII